MPHIKVFYCLYMPGLEVQQTLKAMVPVACCKYLQGGGGQSGTILSTKLGGRGKGKALATLVRFFACLAMFVIEIILVPQQWSIVQRFSVSSPK